MAKWFVQIHGQVEVEADTITEAKKKAGELAPFSFWTGIPKMVGRDVDEAGWPLRPTVATE